MSVKWKHKEAKKELAFLVKLLGNPTVLGRQKGGLALWNVEALQKTKLFGLPNCLDEYEIRDESVFHKFPSEHHDNQYASIVIDIEPRVLEFVLSLSGSIMYDPLKRLLTARCGNIAANVASLYLALRIIENPARLKNIHEKGMYARLIGSMHKMGGIRGIDVKQTERVYKGLCRLKRDLPQAPNKGYWRGAFSESGGPPMIDGKYLGDGRHAVHADMIAKKRAEAATRRANAKQAIQKKKLSRSEASIEARNKEAETVEDMLEEKIWASNARSELKKYNKVDPSLMKPLPTPVLKYDMSEEEKLERKRKYEDQQRSSNVSGAIYYGGDEFRDKYGIPDDVVFQVNPSEIGMSPKNVAAALDSIYDLEDGALQSSVPDRDIDLDLAQQYKRDNNREVEISSIEPFQGRPGRQRSDIDLDLSELYKTSYDRPVRVVGIEPMQVGRNGTNNWAQQLAAAEDYKAANSAAGNTHNKNNAREYFCGRRQYNPDIPPCRSHEDHPGNRGCDPCDNYVKVYHTGLRPAESTDPTCYYGRRHDPYVDTAAYMRHYEDNAHDPGFYNNFY